ncbi:MAG: LysR substrate-binding domain-containing protein [Pseudomonas protegens]|uniref:LysR substrate-binding domain-containing protein n=1 Tax=Pseudomonas protegens TaxID=380021 RepID=UPI00383A83A3
MNSNLRSLSPFEQALAKTALHRVNDYRLPSLDALLAFAVAAQMMSIDRAAKSLSLTNSALRKRIFTLEQLLGLQLFDRQGGPLALTVEGQIYLDQIAPILTQLLAVPLHRRQAQRKQRLTLNCPPTFARQILVPRLAEHSLAHPDIDLQIQLCAPLTRRTGQDINICGDSAHVAPQQRLLNELLQPMAAPALLERFGYLHLPRDFSRLPLLRSPLEPWRPWLLEARLSLPEPDHGPALLDLGMMLEAAANAQGVVLARPSLAHPWLADGRLLPLGRVRCQPSYHYALHQQNPSPAAQTLCTWLRQVCRDAVHQAEKQLQNLL